MSIFIGQVSLARRGLSVLRGVGAWVAIQPAQTYVAASIPGLGTCKSTYVQPQRRELPERVRNARRPLLPLTTAAIVALGLLSGCAMRAPMADHGDVTEHVRSERGLADCQIPAGPVSPGRTVPTDVAGDGSAGCDAAGRNATGWVGLAGIGSAAGPVGPIEFTGNDGLGAGGSGHRATA